MERFERRLRTSDPGLAELLRRIPLQESPPLAPEWLRCEMLERHQLVRRTGVREGSTVLEVGAGGHGIATVPLAYALGHQGRVLAVERSRWGRFRTVVAASGLTERVRPIAADARWLPLREDGVDHAFCLHGVRSLESEETMVKVFREMLRVAPRISVAESLPIASTEAQRAHLAMYDLREELFEATTGRRDDLPYPPLDRVVQLIESAGGAVESAEVVEINLPHALAYFPRSMVEAVTDASTRLGLLRRWDEAFALCERYGADHPPVGIVSARRK